jgi:signal transduction histidine kinase
MLVTPSVRTISDMNRVGGNWATRGRPWSRTAAFWTALVSTGLPTLAMAQDASASAPGVVLLSAMVFALAVAVIALVVGATALFRSARVRERLTEDLRESRARAQSLDPLLDVWLWQSDREHRIVSLRPPHGAGAREWSGTQEALSFVWDEFKADDDAALRAQLKSAAPLDDVPVRRSSPTGAASRGVLRARALTDAAGHFAGFHGTLRDLPASVESSSGATARVASSAVTATAHATSGIGVNGMASAQGSDGTEADHESFSFTVSHDLRAPIRVVEGFTKIVKEDYGRLLDRVGNDHLDRVLSAAARMNNMIDALLALSKLSSQPLARQPVNLSQLAGYVADDLRRQWPDRIVQIEIESDMQVQGDPTLLRAVVENLLGNAWKYTGKAAQPSIAFARHPDDPDSFTVRDNGAGFDMRFADRLFGVFQRLHSANDFPGTGVGLASVRRIVRRHGGEIWGEAEVNHGARFHFSLPQSGDPRTH